MLVCPVGDPEFATNRIHGEIAQRELYRDVMKCCTQRRTAVDVGAHIGIWTRMMAADFARVHAFEPNAENFSCLQRNASSLEVVRTYHLACGASLGTASQKLPHGGNSGMWHLSAGYDFDVYPLDGLALHNVDLLKIDVEGYEGSVIEGARNTLIASSPVVVFEDNGNGPKHFGEYWRDPKPLLRDLGYRMKFRWRKDEVWTRR